MIYHYTDINGLMGILDEEALWATRIDFLNDYDEFILGVDRVESYLNDLYKNMSLRTVDQCEAIKDLHERLSELKEDLYITSFSKCGDNLYHWNSYCPKNSGYCIGFDEMEIKGSERVFPFISDVKYNMDDMTLALENISNKNYSKVDFLKFIIYCAGVKSKEFKDEVEIRLISALHKDKKVYHRNTSSGIIIPYIKHDVSLEGIKEIWIGPNSNTPLARKGLESFLKSKNMSKNLIKESGCSLRVV